MSRQPRPPFVNGDEQDALASQRIRHRYVWLTRAGVAADIKRRYRRRERQLAEPRPADRTGRSDTAAAGRARRRSAADVSAGGHCSGNAADDNRPQSAEAAGTQEGRA